MAAHRRDSEPPVLLGDRGKTAERGVSQHKRVRPCSEENGAVGGPAVFFGPVGLNTFEMSMQNGRCKGLMNRREAVGKEKRIFYVESF